MGIVCIPTTFWLTTVHREVAFALEDRNRTHDEDIVDDADKDRGGYTLPNLNVGFIEPQNTLVGPIWRCCGQKTRPPSHFWVPFQPNLVFALFTWENGPKLAKNEQISKFA